MKRADVNCLALNLVARVQLKETEMAEGYARRRWLSYCARHWPERYDSMPTPGNDPDEGEFWSDAWYDEMVAELESVYGERTWLDECPVLMYLAGGV